MTRLFAAEQHLMEGAAQSPVRVLIYEDLQCPDCADFRTMLDNQLLPRYAATVRFEHRDFPLAKHPWARKAAIAARFFEEAQPGLGISYRKYALANLRDINLTNFNAALSQFASGHGVDPAKAVAGAQRSKLGGAGGKRLSGRRGARHCPDAHHSGEWNAIHRNLRL